MNDSGDRPPRPLAQSLCALCGRPFGRRWERHHVIPKLKGGRETVDLHPICHRKIHAVFSEAELARHKGSLEPVRQHPDIVSFLRWLAKKPPDFYKITRANRR